MEHKKILTLIENVDPQDNAALDEIDARVWCWLEDCKFKRMLNNKYPTLSASKFSFYEDDQIYYKLVSGIRYCTCRDALKAIRPEGYLFTIQKEYHSVGNTNPTKTINWFCLISSVDRCKIPSFKSDPISMPTEELAELHAIIQAIAWERQSDGTE